MATGTLTSVLLLLAVAGPPSDVIPMNSHNFKIPISIKDSERAKIKELHLFTSSDQGLTWNEYSVATPDKDAFTFYAQTDGIYWFTIAVVGQNGKREPADIYKSAPGQKVLVDTLKPNVRITAADRQGDEIVVGWEIQEDHPDLTTLKVEYRTPDAPAWVWYKVEDLPRALTGQAHFRFVNSGAVQVRVQMLDEAGNPGSAQADIAAKVVASSAATGMLAPTGSPGPVLNPTPAAAQGGSLVTSPSATPASPPFTQPASGVPANVERMPPIQPATLTQADPRTPPDRAWMPTPVTNSGFQQVNAYIPESSSRYSPGGVNGGNLVSPAPGARWPNAPLLPAEITNNTEVTLNYAVTGVGPSGVGSVELYLTQDEGQTWQRLTSDPDCEPPMKVNLPGEGIYGLRLVVGSRAGLGRKPPKSGDLPQMRLEVDTTAPAVKLFYPQADPRRRDVLLLTWTAADRNLAANPITLKWSSTRRDNDWHDIAAELTNSGRYTWQLTSNLPDRVYLRVLARDTAGNVGMDEIPEPVLVDLHEPEGQLLGIIGTTRR